MIDPRFPVQGQINPMAQFNAPVTPQQLAALQQLMILLGGINPTVSPTPQPQPGKLPPVLGGPSG